MGEGHAGAAIHNGRVYVIDYDRDKQEDAIRCLSLDSGEEIWRYTYSVEIKRNHGMSRTVPVVNDKYVVALGPKLHLHCLDAVTGEKKWFIDLVKDYDCVIPQWYAGQCPLIEGDTVIIAPGTKPLIMRVNLETGEVVWRSQPDLDDMGMTHSSVLPIEFEGIRQYVYCTQEGAVGVAADDGRRLWTLPDWKIGIANIPTPVWLGDGRLFFSGGYEKGSMMAQLEKTADGGIGAKELWSLPARDFGSDQQTPIYYNGHIYGVKPRPAELLCLDPKDGARLWTSGGARRFGLGPYVIVDDLLFVLDDRSCNLHMLEANPKEYKELGRAQMMDGHDAWAPMAFANGLLILRDLTIMKCVDLRK
jgi:outer membrane protein assembly factor BamB